MNNEEAIEIFSKVKELPCGWCYEGGDEFKQAINLAINALEESKQGEWIMDGHHIRCNKCNEYICNTDREGNKIPDNFCPNCGVDMRRKNKLDYKVINRGKCMLCGKELTEGLFFCKECEEKGKMKNDS